MAEEIWFNYVWEEKKDPSNVIDYNINSEQTKDLSAEKNANNQTTTGMADVIPWINAPKLIAKTSIIWWSGGWSVKYAEIALNYNGTMPQWEFTNFNQMTVTWDSFVSIDSNYPTHILIDVWTYIGYVYINVHSSSRQFTSSSRFWKSDWTTTLDKLYEINNATTSASATFIFSITESWWHLRIWINPSNWTVSNLSSSVFRLMKLW
jgi:hypothetical protein